MGARPSSFKKGSGYLNEVDALIAGYQFLVGDTVKVKKGNRKGEDFTPLSLELTFQVDGADQAQTKRLLIGDATFFGDVSDDGKTLYTPEGQNISAGTEAGIFLSSLVSPETGDGFPEDRFSDSDTEINFQPMVGTRVRLQNQIDAEKTKRQGKEKGKNGKEYDRRTLRVGQVYDLPTAARGKGNGAAAKTGKSAGKPTAKPSGDASEITGAALTAYLDGAKDKTLHKSKLRMKVLTDPQFKGNTELRDEVAKLLINDEYLAGLSDSSIEYDKSSGTIVLSA